MNMKPADKFDPGKWLIENKLTNQSKLNEMQVANPLSPPEDIKEYFLELIQIYSDGNDTEYNEGQEVEVSFEGINFEDGDMDIEDREGFKNARNYLKKNGPTILNHRIKFTFFTDGGDIIMKWTEPNWDELNEMQVANPVIPPIVKFGNENIDKIIRQIVDYPNTTVYQPFKLNKNTDRESAYAVFNMDDVRRIIVVISFERDPDEDYQESMEKISGKYVYYNIV